MQQFSGIHVRHHVLNGLLTLTLLAGYAAAQEPAKQINVSGAEAPLDVKVRTSKTTYDVNEPIVFQITPNRDVYVYLFNVPDDSPTAIQLFPNVHEEGHKPLAAHHEVSIPGKSVFRSDRAGTEKVVLVASSQPLMLSSTKSLGEFTTVQQEEVNTLVKQMRVDAPATAPQRLVKQMEVVIQTPEAGAGTRETVMPAASRATVLLTTDKAVYQTTERVTITYVADTKGHLALYLLNPDKQRTLLEKRSVERDKTYKYSAQALPPVGDHVLLAVFHKRSRSTRQMEALATQMLTPEQVGKDLGPVVEPPDAYKTHHFTIK